jgi:hypothetical protein
VRTPKNVIPKILAAKMSKQRAYGRQAKLYFDEPAIPTVSSPEMLPIFWSSESRWVNWQVFAEPTAMGFNLEPTHSGGV